MPDVFRGKYRLADDDLENTEKLTELGVKYAKEVKSAIARLEGNGRKIAAFFMESLISCGGQIIPPPKYLENVVKYAKSLDKQKKLLTKQF